VDQSPASIVITDAQGCIQFVNQGFTRVTGYERHECLGKNPRLLKSGHHPRKLYQELWGTILAGQVWEGELCNRRKSGELYWESARIAPVRDESQGISHFIAIKQEASRLKRVESTCRRVLEGMRDGFLEALVGGGITQANPAAAHILGYDSPDELVGLPTGQVLADLAAMLTGPSSFKGLTRLRDRQGQARSYPADGVRLAAPIPAMPIMQLLFHPEHMRV
jgi:PAS domain S-box-containing protein